MFNNTTEMLFQVCFFCSVIVEFENVVKYFCFVPLCSMETFTTSPQLHLRMH